MKNGQKLSFRAPQEMVAAVDELVASGYWQNRAQAIRHVLASGLNIPKIKMPTAVVLAECNKLGDVSFVTAAEIAAGTDISAKQAGHALASLAEADRLAVDVTKYQERTTAHLWRVDPAPTVEEVEHAEA